MDAVIAPFAFVDASSISTGNYKSRLGGCIFINLFCSAIFNELVSKLFCESEVKALNFIVQEDYICCYLLDHFFGIAKTWSDPVLKRLRF